MPFHSSLIGNSSNSRGILGVLAMVAAGCGGVCGNADGARLDAEGGGRDDVPASPSDAVPDESPSDGATMGSDLGGVADGPATGGMDGQPALRIVEDFRCVATLPERLIFHPVCLDETEMLVPWLQVEAPYADVSRRAWNALKGVTNLPNGKPTYYSSPMFAGQPPDVWAIGAEIPHHPAGVLAMFVDAALRYYAYAADPEIMSKIVLPFADHILAHGMTLASDSWANVPYSCSDILSLDYHGSSLTTGSGDGPGNLEPDKVGEVGFAFLQLYEHTGQARYLDTALACANALVAHQQPGDSVSSPWPFRVDAATGQRVVDGYSAQVVGALRLFRELRRLGLDDSGAFRRAHDAALAWALSVPFVNGKWSNYFEDIITIPDGANRNQYAPLELARYLLDYPDVASDAVAKAKALIEWAATHFAVDVANNDCAGGVVYDPGIQYGAEVLSEQEWDTNKMGSHTARLASVLARYYELTGDAAARARAFRSFNWATYCSDQAGLVRVGTNPCEGYWWSDGYGDYVRHFMAGLGSVPEWAPATENHLVRSSSVLLAVDVGSTSLRYTTFDDAAEDVLRLAAPPARIAVGPTTVTAGEGEGHYTLANVASGGVVVILRRTGGSTVTVSY